MFHVLPRLRNRNFALSRRDACREELGDLGSARLAESFIFWLALSIGTFALSGTDVCREKSSDFSTPSILFYISAVNGEDRHLLLCRSRSMHWATADTVYSRMSAYIVLYHVPMVWWILRNASCLVILQRLDVRMWRWLMPRTSVRFEGITTALWTETSGQKGDSPRSV